MSDDSQKKPKIDLKARLGKGTLSGTPGSAPGSAPGSNPMSSAPGVVPPPIAPPPGAGLGPSMAPAPFAPRASVGVPPLAQAQTIKVELGEEVHEVQARAKKRAAVGALAAAVIAGVIGFVAGGGSERSARDAKAIEGASSLATDVSAAIEKMKEFDAKLNTAMETLSKKREFPADLVAYLPTLNVDFDAQKLEGKGVGNLPGATFRSLLSFTSGVQDINKGKASLSNLLSLARPQIETALKVGGEPVVSFSVLMMDGPGGAWGQVVPLTTPFPVGKGWPAEFEVKRPEVGASGITETAATPKRYAGGEAKGTAIPLDPMTTVALTNQEVIRKMVNTMRDMHKTLAGDESNPQEPVPGLLTVGEQLASDLNKIAKK